MIHIGDSLEIMKTLDPSTIDAIVTDPPYGINYKCDSKRFSGGNCIRGQGKKWPRIANDDKPFDPSPWLAWDKVVMFGYNHFASRLPVGTSLIWIKRNEQAYGSFLSDAEMAWMKGGHGVYCFKDMSYQASNQRFHPTCKPIPLMQWVIRKLKLKPNATILDPFCGSGSTGVAAIREGFNFIGIELNPEYAEIANRRIEHEKEKTALLEPMA
ncbi:putative methylase [uncultured Caudovirales phage]|uniref:Putative methylase n=1 Tax=uncultured Caudovirales phage TaxID=2100421 RepID=A0A6J7WFR6_9CAUD|nr:putative methylase [uncultured Caudovirales phage]